MEGGREESETSRPESELWDHKQKRETAPVLKVETRAEASAARSWRIMFSRKNSPAL
jgi:hypothetical protein